MRREMKISVSIALILMTAFMLLSSSSTVKTAHAGPKPSSQSSAEIKPEQKVIARATIPIERDRQAMAATGVEFLDRRIGDDFFILTTFARLEELKQQGYPVTLLYFRELDFQETWRSAQVFAGDCTFTIEKTQKIVTGHGGIARIKLLTGAECEWVAFSDSPWLRLDPVGQGTGPATIDSAIEMNPTSTNRVGHIFVQGNVFTVYQGATFADVPFTHPLYVEIGIISALGITQGCDSENFCPDKTIPRDQAAAFIIRTLGEFNPPTPAMQRFTDVPPSNPFYNFIDRMAVLGITQGCSPTTYCPADGISRQHAAAFVIRSLGEVSPPTPAFQRFADVLPSNPFYNFIDRMAVLEITRGCSLNPPLYCPFDAVSRGQMAAFLMRAYHLQAVNET
jgi:hypothetical protein